MDTIGFRVLEDNQKQKMVAVHNRMAYSNYGMFFLKLVKLTTMQGNVYCGETSTGHPIHRGLEPDEIIKRALSLVEKTYAEMESRKWFILTAPIEDLVEERLPMAGFTGDRK